MDDTISRQAAIDASEKLTRDCNPEHFIGQPKFIEFMDDAEIGSFGMWQFANGFNIGLTAAEGAIERLPPAHPEIIRCKDCEHFHYDMPYVIQGLPVIGHEVCDFWGGGCKTAEDGFCSYAERRHENG